MHSTDARPHLRCGPLCRHYSKIGMGTFLPAVAAYVPAPPRPPPPVLTGHVSSLLPY